MKIKCLLNRTMVGTCLDPTYTFQIQAGTLFETAMNVFFDSSAYVWLVLPELAPFKMHKSCLIPLGMTAAAVKHKFAERGIREWKPPLPLDVVDQHENLIPACNHTSNRITNPTT